MDNDTESGVQRLRKSLRQSVVRWFEAPVANALVAIGFTPNAATLAGFLLTAIAAILAATGHFLAAGILCIPAALFDLIDGAIARRTGKTSDRGALLDSTADRLAEAMLLLGLLIYFSSADANSRVGVILCFVAFLGSMMVSYVRARAEGLGYKGTAGFLTRPERVVIMTATLIIGLPILGLWILAVGTPASAFHRFWSEWRNAK